MSSGRKIPLVCEDGEMFRVDEEVASVSEGIKEMIETGDGYGGIIVPDVVGKIMSRIIEYCRKHVETPNSEDENLKDWDAEFVNVDPATLVLFILAANRLKIKSLLVLSLEKFVDIRERMTKEEINKIYRMALEFNSKEVEK